MIFLMVLFPSSFPTKILHAFLFSPFVLHARPSHPHWLHHTWRRVQVMKLLIMQFSPTSCHFISLWSKYCPHHSVSAWPKNKFKKNEFSPVVLYLNTNNVYAVKYISMGQMIINSPIHLHFTGFILFMWIKDTLKGNAWIIQECRI
jgi:hypothetical protein